MVCLSRGLEFVLVELNVFRRLSKRYYTMAALLGFNPSFGRRSRRSWKSVRTKRLESLLSHASWDYDLMGGKTRCSHKPAACWDKIRQSSSKSLLQGVIFICRELQGQCVNNRFLCLKILSCSASLSASPSLLADPFLSPVF